MSLLYPSYQKQRIARNDPRDQIICLVTNGVGVITSAPLVSVTTLVIPDVLKHSNT